MIRSCRLRAALTWHGDGEGPELVRCSDEDSLAGQRLQHAPVPLGLHSEAIQQEHCRRTIAPRQLALREGMRACGSNGTAKIAVVRI